jgi:DNA-binding transcriptional LysR family regulator
MRSHRFIVLDESYRESPFQQWLDSQLPPDSYRTTVSSFLCAAALCRRGMGITILPDYLLERQDLLVRLPTDAPIPGNNLWILSHPDSRDKVRVRIVRRHLQQRLIDRFGPVSVGDFLPQGSVG